MGGWINSHVTARISRTTARETALLAAAQRRRDAEITQLRDAQTDLLEAATAVQSYVWYVDKETRLRTTIDVEDWHATREFVECAVVGHNDFAQSPARCHQMNYAMRTSPSSD